MEMNNFEISDSISSPVVALEQLASELAQERARCTQALRDRARQKVVIEKLLQNQGLLQSQLRQLKEQLAASMEQAEHGSFEQSQQGYQLAAHVRELAQTKRELEEASNEVAKLRIANQEQRDLLSSLSVELNGLRSQLEAEQDRSRSLEAAAETLRKDLDRARAGRAEADGSVTGLTSKIYEQMKEINDLKTKSRLADAISDKYAALMQDDAEIRDRLEESLKRNHSFAQEVRDLSEKSVEKDLEIASLREQLERQSREAEVMLEDLEEARRAQTELSLQADALRSSAASEKARVESMTRSHEYFQSHIAELRDAHTTSLQKYTALEIEYSKAQSKISSLNVEITETKNQLAQLEVFSKEAESAAALALEVERLSSELSDVRRQLVRRDLDEEAAVALLQRQQSVGGDMGSCELGTSGLLSVKLLSEREKHSKQVYEGIIEDLRNSIEALTAEKFNIAQQLEIVSRKAARVDRLEDEVAMYKEAVKANAVENQSAVLSAYEALERNQKTTHDSQTLLRSVRAAEQSLALAQAESARLRQELQDERRRARTLHTDKLGAERRVTEMLAEISRLETVVAELTAQNEMKTYEMSKMESSITELQQACYQLKQRGASATEDAEAAQTRIADLLIQLQAQTRAHEQASAEARALRDSKATLQAEITMLNNVLAAQRQSATESTAQIEKLRLNVISLQNALEVKQKDNLRMGSLSAEQQLKGIRGDLSRTIGDWKETERERMEREEVKRRLQNELVKERDKSQLLVSQISKLEDRLMQANKELASYRVVDVYRSSKEAELASMRMANAGLSKNSPSSSSAAAASEAGSHCSDRFVSPLGSNAPSVQRGNAIDELSDDDDGDCDEYDGDKGYRGGDVARADASKSVPAAVPPEMQRQNPRPSTTTASTPRSTPNEALSGDDGDRGGSSSLFDRGVPYVPFAPLPASSALGASSGTKDFEQTTPTSFRYIATPTPTKIVSGAHTPWSSSSSSSGTAAATTTVATGQSNTIQVVRPPVRPHRDLTYDPSKADFDRARKLLLSMSGGPSRKK